MTRLDLERTRRRLMGVTTDADRDAKLDEAIRFRPAPDEDTSPYGSPFFLPPGFFAADTTSNHSPVTNRTFGRYLGQAPYDLSYVTIRVNVVVAAATITWAEVGIATSIDMVMGSGADLIPEGFTNVASTFNSTGAKDTEVAVSIGKGAHVWALLGQQATTLYELRRGIGDGISIGFMQIADATRPSTMANPTTFTLSSASGSAIWIGCQW
jgi:hypothetical protein